MLGEAMVMATIAVKDVEAAKKFYEGVLGLNPGKQDPSGIDYLCGNNSHIFVYQSDFAGTNKATYASWNVKDIDAVVQALKDKGVKFEHYDLPGAELKGDIHVMGELKAAWFKDPDGNILSIDSGM